MSIEVKSLSEDMSTVFVDYLGNLDFGHAPHWSTCYCRFYHTGCSGEEWQKRTGEENRLEAIDQIKAGNMKGYLAFDGEKCIGWCNANDIAQMIRLESYVKPLVGNQRVGCVICFVIHPEYRGQGVARLLLKQAIADFKSADFDAVLALPLEMDTEPEKLYRGTLNMYKELGFREVERHEQVRVMRLDLRD